MKINKIFASLMMLLTLVFAACNQNTPTPPSGPNGGGNGNGNTTPTEYGDTLTVAQAIEYVKSLGTDVLSEQPKYVKGIISGNLSVNLSFGNATFDIKDEGVDNKFTCFQVNYLENSGFTSEDQLQIGDEVVVYGKICNYKGNTPETEGKGAAYVSEHNGETKLPAWTDPEAKRVTIAEAIAVIDALAEGAVTPEYYEIECEVSKLNTNETNLATYGNVNYIIKDATGSMTAYQTNNVGNVKFTSMSEVPQAGSKLVIVGHLTLYVNKNNGNKSYEIAPCYIKEVIEFKGASDNPGQETANVLTGYRVKAGDLEEAVVSALKAGDKVVIKTQLINWQGNTPETENASFVNINGEVPAEAITAAEAIEICKGLEKSTKDNRVTAENGKEYIVAATVKEIFLYCEL